MSIKCPNCQATLGPRDVAEGWCDNCGKKIPSFVVTEAGGGRPSSSIPGIRGPSFYLQPHRGSAILVLGILSLLTCAPLGIIAWVMGSRDLAAMRQGRMDRSGEGITQAGQILGIIGSVFFALGFCLFSGMMILAILSER